MTIPNLRSCVLGRDEKHIGGSIRTFVRNYTDDGVVGTGECNSANGDCSGSATKEGVLVPRPHWIGQDPTTIPPVHEDPPRRGRYSGADQAPSILALTGIENALLDILGTKHGILASALLGSAYRKNIRLYADCSAGQMGEPEPFTGNAHKAIEDGLQCIEIRCG